MVLIVGRGNLSALGHAGFVPRADVEVVCKAVERNFVAFQFASILLRSDLKFMSECGRSTAGVRRSLHLSCLLLQRHSHSLREHHSWMRDHGTLGIADYWLRRWIRLSRNIFVDASFEA